MSVAGGEVGQQPNTTSSNGVLTDFVGHIAGFKDASTLTNGACDGTSLTLDSTRGITVGMIVNGTDALQTLIDAGTPITVAAVSSLTAVTLSSAQTIGDDVALTFSGNPSISVIDIQATRVDNNIKVQGLLNVQQVDRSADAYLNIDDFINVT